MPQIDEKREYNTRIELKQGIETSTNLWRRTIWYATEYEYGSWHPNLEEPIDVTKLRVDIWWA